MLHIDAEWLDALRAESIDVHDRYRKTEPVRIAQDPRAYKWFSALNAKLFSEASVSEKEAALIEFVGDYDYETGLTLFPPASTTANNEKLEIVLDFLRIEHNAVPTLAELADLVGMSRYQLIRVFRTFTGMTPHAWHLNQRINHARQYLLAGVPLAEVAYRLGFADQSHFQRIFKAHTGITPGNYRS